MDSVEANNTDATPAASSSTSISTSLASQGFVLDPNSSTARGGLRKDVSSMMFGFGDSWPPDERLASCIMTTTLQVVDIVVIVEVQKL